jgi:hypothetical protein
MRIGGVVAYTDGTWSSFGAILDSAGNNPVSSESVEVFRQLWAGGGDTLVQTTTDLLGTWTFAMAAPTTSKTVSKFTLDISGIVSYDDGTHGAFGAQHSPLASAFLTVTGSATHWAAAIAVTAFKTQLDTTIELVTGSASMTLT